MPEYFADFWYPDLIKLYASIRYYIESGDNPELLANKKKDFIGYINFIRRSWGIDMNEELIDSCLATMSIKGMNPLYIMCIIAQEYADNYIPMDLERIIHYSCDFKDFLPTLYSLIGESATLKDIKNIVDSIISTDESPIDDLLLSECKWSLGTMKPKRVVVRMRTKWGFSPSLGKAISVNKAAIEDFYSVAKRLYDNESK